MKDDLSKKKNLIETKLKHYSVEIADHLHDRLSKHLRLLSNLGYRSRQQWVLDALNEKLKKEEAAGVEAISKERRLHLKLDEKIHQELDKRVEIRKKVRRSYSKKQWLVDAISEKLEREEVSTKKKLEKFLLPGKKN